MTTRTEPDDGGRIAYRSEADRAGFARLSHLVVIDAELTDGAVRLYARLLWYARQKDNCWPGVATLADDLNKSERTVKRGLADLVERGLITRERRQDTTSKTWVEPLDTIYSVGDKNGLNQNSVGDKFGLNLYGPNLSPKEEVKKKGGGDDSSSKRATLAKISILYESEIGPVTERTAKRLEMLIAQYPWRWQWERGFDAVVLSGRRRLDYLSKCLENAGKPEVKSRIRG